MCSASASLQATGWLPEPWLDEFAPSAEELALRAAEMSDGVMLLFERLKPDERAAFVLHEAFDCDYAEIGRILERSAASCRQIVHRARARLQRAGAPLHRADPESHARIVERLRNALEAQDRTSLLELFSDAPQRRQRRAGVRPAAECAGRLTGRCACRCLDKLLCTRRCTRAWCAAEGVRPCTHRRVNRALGEAGWRR